MVSIDANFAADRLVAEPEPVFDRPLDVARDLALGRFQHEPIGAPAPSSEHTEPGQKSAARLALDHEQRIDRPRSEHETAIVLANFDGEIVDVDHHAVGVVATRCDRNLDPQGLLARANPPIGAPQPQIRRDRLGQDVRGRRGAKLDGNISSVPRRELRHDDEFALHQADDVLRCV